MSPLKLALDVGGAQTGCDEIPWPTTTTGTEGSLPTVWTTEDGGLVVPNAMLSLSVHSRLCIIVGEHTTLTKPSEDVRDGDAAA